MGHNLCRGELVKFTKDWLRHINDPCDVYRDAIFKVMSGRETNKLYIEIKAINDEAKLVCKALDKEPSAFYVTPDHIERLNGLERAASKASYEV